MHPLAALAVSSAVEGFGKEFGKEVAESLFGGGGDTAAVKRALKEIAAELRAINIKLDYMTSLLERLPSVVLAQYRQELLDEGYRLLQATDDVLRATADGGQINPPTREFAIQLLSAWRRVVELEVRPQQLMMLPYWSELVRFSVAGDISIVLQKGIGGKLAALDALISQGERSLDEMFTEADLIVKRPYFSSGKTLAAAPFITWAIAPVPYRTRSGGHDGNLEIRVYDESFARQQSASVARLTELRSSIDNARSAVQAAVPPAELLRLYLQTLAAPATKAVELPFEIDPWQASGLNISFASS